MTHGVRWAKPFSDSSTLLLKPSVTTFFPPSDAAEVLIKSSKVQEKKSEVMPLSAQWWKHCDESAAGDDSGIATNCKRTFVVTDEESTRS